MKRYKLNPIIIAPPNKGFLIQTPTGKTLFDTRPRGIVRELNRLNDRIKQLEDRIHRAAMAFFRDGSDGQVASGMLAILEEERGKL